MHPDPHATSYHHFRRSACLTAVLLAATSTVDSARAETATIRVPKAVIGAAFNVALSSSRVVVDDFGRKRGTTWHTDDSYVLLPDGKRHPFVVPEYTFSITPTRAYRYYIDDLRTSQVRVYPDGDTIRLVAEFESQGEEIKAKCVRRRLGKWSECSLPVERDVQLDNTRLEVALRPVAYAGGISFATDPAVRFASDVKISNRLCGVARGICGWVQDKIRTALARAVARGVRASLNLPSSRLAVAHAVRETEGLRGLVDPTWKVTGVRSQGGDFLVTVKRPARIGADAVTRLALATVPPASGEACPTRVSFKAIIRTRNDLRGTGQLEFEDGSLGRSFPWNARGGKYISSRVERSIKVQPGQTRSGWTRMLVRWQGSDGKAYSLRSNRASWSVACKPARALGR